MMRRMVAMYVMWGGLLVAQAPTLHLPDPQAKPTSEQLLREVALVFDSYLEAESVVLSTQDDYEKAKPMFDIARWDSLSPTEKRWVAEVYERYAAAAKARLNALTQMAEIRRQVRRLLAAQEKQRRGQAK